MSVDPALGALMTGLIDYAGLFPPAGLSLEPALGRYLDYRRGRDRWMLGSFICPVGRLAELTELLEARRELLPSPPLPLSLILRPAESDREALRLVERDLEWVASLAPRLAGLAEVRGLELRLPEALLLEERPAVLRGFLGGAKARIGEAALASAPLFLERTLLGELRRDALEALVEVCRELNEPDRGRLGLKLRCGGLEAAAIPSPSAVASAIALCQRRALPFKATAGLHHPIRRLDEGLGAKTLGFFNLFAGAALASAQELGEPHLYALLEEESAASFRFEDGSLSWGYFRASAEEVRHARATLATSFGSCSFDEPREDLRALGLLEREDG